MLRCCLILVALMCTGMQIVMRAAAPATHKQPGPLAATGRAAAAAAALTLGASASPIAVPLQALGISRRPEGAEGPRFGADTAALAAAAPRAAQQVLQGVRATSQAVVSPQIGASARPELPSAAAAATAVPTHPTSADCTRPQGLGARHGGGGARLQVRGAGGAAHREEGGGQPRPAVLGVSGAGLHLAAWHSAAATGTIWQVLPD